MNHDNELIFIHLTAEALSWCFPSRSCTEARSPHTQFTNRKHPAELRAEHTQVEFTTFSEPDPVCGSVSRAVLQQQQICFCVFHLFYFLSQYLPNFRALKIAAICFHWASTRCSSNCTKAKISQTWSTRSCCSEPESLLGSDVQESGENQKLLTTVWSPAKVLKQRLALQNQSHLKWQCVSLISGLALGPSGPLDPASPSMPGSPWQTHHTHIMVTICCSATRTLYTGSTNTCVDRQTLEKLYLEVICLVLDINPLRLRKKTCTHSLANQTLLPDVAG